MIHAGAGHKALHLAEYQNTRVLPRLGLPILTRLLAQTFASYCRTLGLAK